MDMPIYASHHEPEFFPEPAKFDPERFLKENATDIIPHTYRPFGGKLDFVVSFGQNTYISLKWSIYLLKRGTSAMHRLAVRHHPHEGGLGQVAHALQDCRRAGRDRCGLTVQSTLYLH